MNTVNYNLSKLPRHVFNSPLEAARSLIIRMNGQALAKSGDEKYDVALSGGSTPDVLFRLWANEYAHTTPWKKFRFFWVDERCVPPTDDASNYGRFKVLLSDSVPDLKEGENVFRIIGEASPETEALRYSELVTSHVPQFDLVILGIGPDGHTSSIFPGQEHLLSASQLYMPSIHPVTSVKRVAMTAKPMMHAKQTIFMITGSGKADIINRIINDGFNCPASRVMQQAEAPELLGDYDALGNV
jgi:6-phosphogluconolactonase